MKRSSGMLLHISSLPGPYGIGKIGPAAVEFARKISRCGFQWWQILPFGPPAAGYSPYQCYSAFAGNPMLISPDWLYEKGWLDQSELEECMYKGSPYSCDYKWIDRTTDIMLRRAYKRLSQSDLNFVAVFAEKQKNWLPDFAVFMTARKKFKNRKWWEWNDRELAMHDTAAFNKFREKNIDEINYHCFVQYVFEQQWKEVHDAVKRTGIRVIGDLPIYVSLDSSDVWANRKYFELDEAMKPVRVAGVPPDYFTADGQLWGNPLYRWDIHEKEGYLWWTSRIRQTLHWFDCVRLDHFRGFDSYYAVAADAENARSGEWLPGPKTKLFDVLFSEFSKTAFIAEDLGDIDESVRLLLSDTGLPGMRVLQFGFDPASDSMHLPFRYPENSVAFTGTHDNNTLLGWLWDIDDSERDFALSYAGIEEKNIEWGRGGPSSPAVRALIRIVWASPSYLAVAPVQDFLGYGSDTRMNKPGQADGQWTYRLTETDMDSLDEQWIKRLNQTFRRHRSTI
jgi:4-alpha-glucanotransferase